MIKIAICGQLRAGKDEVANRIYHTHDYFEKLAFGDALKRLYHELLPWVPTDPKPRAGYQKFGQLAREQFGEDIWIRHAERMLGFYERVKRPDGVLITDLRQPNEYEWARANGWIIVRVTAPDELRLARAKAAGDQFDAKDLAHDTEQHVGAFDVDYEIVNDGTIDELYAKVDAMMSEIGNRSSTV
ncbi:dephospho-CoA kinase [Niallia sp. FSL M8-0099]|uniref:dephospho-CoA kinase n=1 Tax=Niallia sp. FSL M8-0099 TaxID=2954519 RepID=UPI0030FCE2F7